MAPGLAHVAGVHGCRSKGLVPGARWQWLSGRCPAAAHHFALIDLVHGEKDNALGWLEKARQQRTPMMAWLKVDPRFDNVRPAPRFRAMMRKVGLL